MTSHNKRYPFTVLFRSVIYIYIEYIHIEYILYIYSSVNISKHQNYKNENSETQNPWYDWLISYIPVIIKKKWWAVLKTKIMNLFKTNATKD